MSGRVKYDSGRGKSKSCPSATLSTTHLTQTDLGLKPCLHDGRRATNCLSHSNDSNYPNT